MPPDLNAFLAEEGSTEPTQPENATPPGGEFEQQVAEAADSQPPVNEIPEGEQPPAEEEQPPEGLDKRGEAIWREERTKRKELQAQVDKMNERWMDLVARMQQQQPQQPQQAQPQVPQQPEIEVPDYEDDPIGHFRAKTEILERQIAELSMDRMQRQQITQQMGQFQQLQQGVSQMEAEFSKVTPDYNEAVGFMYENVAKMATAMGYPPQQVQQTISQMAMDISVRALQQGKNPAQAAYEAAKQMGYTKKAPAAAAGDEVQRPQAPTSLSTVAGKRTATPGIPSLDAIAKMDDPEFEKLWAEMEKAARH